MHLKWCEHTFNPSTIETEESVSLQIQGQTGLHSEFEDCQGYRDFVSKTVPIFIFTQSKLFKEKVIYVYFHYSFFVLNVESIFVEYRNYVKLLQELRKKCHIETSFINQTNSFFSIFHASSLLSLIIPSLQILCRFHLESHQGPFFTPQETLPFQ